MDVATAGQGDRSRVDEKVRRMLQLDGWTPDVALMEQAGYPDMARLYGEVPGVTGEQRKVADHRSAVAANWHRVLRRDWRSAMSEIASELDRLRKQLAQLDDLIEQQRARRSNWGLGLRIGRRPLQYYRHITAVLIFLSYVAFNLIGIIVGAVMILSKGVLRELGVAIVVGSIFAFGSFIAQWWSIEVQQEIDFNSRVYGNLAYQQRLGDMRNETREIIDRLSGSGKDTDS
jgi:hypothetical protein